ncbi:hypothetical protein CDL15_Pgr008282 [Punica granatum]|uniref:Uncharacterized protein n=1 Tax=Punica granatum TaxID=22663 RepID=A0A218XQZ0_PUNGR|nr:hypothetical protein CDL15_Pgr008282 [Punica granatum]
MIVRGLSPDLDGPRVPVGPFWGTVCLSVEQAPEALSEKASVKDRGVPAHVACPGNASGRVIGHFGTERDFWSPILGTFRCFGDSIGVAAAMKLLRRCFALGVAMCLICRKPALLLGRLLVALPNANFVAEAIVVRWGCPGRAMRDSSSGVERLHIPRGRKSEFAVVLALCSTCDPSITTPHFGPPASHTRIPDQNSGRYSSSGNQRQIGGHRVMNNGRRAGSIRKAEESSQKNERTRNPENDGAGIVALFITESPKHRKVPNMGL